MFESVSFDDDNLKGGALSASTKVLETPARDDFRTVMRGAEIQKFENNQGDYFRSAFDMIPKNIYPYFQYEQSHQGQNPNYIRNALLKGLSGHGAKKDPPHIQKAVVHSLKQYPHLLRMYLTSSALILD